MYKRLAIGLGISLGINLLVFMAIVAMAVANKIPLEKIIPVDFIKVEVQKPKPTPPPPPPPKPKKKPDEKKITPTKAPIESDPDPQAVATIQTAPEIEDKPLPQIVNFTELDRPPKRLRFVKPKYPAIARRAGKQGVVVVKFLITKSGSVTNARVVKAPPGLGLGPAALAAVTQWQYETPRINGRAVAAWCVVPIRFQLK